MRLGNVRLCVLSILLSCTHRLQLLDPCSLSFSWASRMELTEQYVNQCMEDFSDSCRDFLRTSLEEMYRNYESFVAERMLSARRRYRELIETMVQDSKPEESLDSLLSDPKEGESGRGRKGSS